MKRKTKHKSARNSETSSDEVRQSADQAKVGRKFVIDDINFDQADTNSRSHGKRIKFFWFAAVALAAWSFGYAVVGASDLWWHLAIGKYVVTTRSLPLTDIWSFTSAGRTWLQHEWLSDVIYELWTRAFGLYGLVYWKWLIIAATFVLVFDTLFRATRSALASYLAVLCAIIVSAPFLDLRPQLYTLLGCAFLLNLLWRRGDRKTNPFERENAGKSFAPPVWLPLVFLVWINRPLA